MVHFVVLQEHFAKAHPTFKEPLNLKYIGINNVHIVSELLLLVSKGL